METAKSSTRRSAEDADPVRVRRDARLNRLIQLNDQIAELERRPKVDLLAARLIGTLRREESGLRRALAAAGAGQSGL